MGGRNVSRRLERDKAQVIYAYQAGTSLSDIARIYFCSETPIRYFLMRNKIPFHPKLRPKILEKYREDVITEYKNGSSPRQIAKKYGVNRNTVSFFLECAGVRRKTPLREREFFIKKDLDIGMLAGLIIGEGSIIIRGRAIRITILNQDAEVMGWLNQFGGRIHWSRPRKRSPNPCAAWDLSRTVDVYHCLKTLEPFLIGKKGTLARAALHVIESNHGLKIS